MEYMDFSLLPEALSAKDISAFLCVSKQTAYCLLHSRSFPSIRVGKRLLSPKPMFIAWYTKQYEKMN